MTTLKATTILVLLHLASSYESSPFGSIEGNQRGFFQPARTGGRNLFNPVSFIPSENVRPSIGGQLFSFAVPQPFNPAPQPFNPMKQHNWNWNTLNNDIRKNSVIYFREQSNMQQAGKYESPSNPQYSTNCEEQGKLSDNIIFKDNIQTTELYSTTDYTSTTEGYETTTFQDELYRSALSEPIVATLLGG